MTDIASDLLEATSAAASPTTTIAAAAADEVSAAVAQLFGGHGQEFHTLSSRIAAYHADFVELLHGSAAGYLSTEIANAGEALATAANAPAQTLLGVGRGTPALGSAAVPGGAYGQLIANTATNLQALGANWAADPFPVLRQVLANQQTYAQQIGAELVSGIQNFPAIVAKLPATIQAAIQQLLTFNATYYIQQIVSTQIGFAQLFGSALNHAVTSLWSGLPAYAAGLQGAFQQALLGNYTIAVSDAARATANLLVTGVNTDNLTFNIVGTTFTATVLPVVLGPLGDFFTMLNIPSQDLQYFTNLIPPSIPHVIAQNFTNVAATLSNPSIELALTVPVLSPTTSTISAFFGLPLVTTYALAGAPLATWNALATSADTIDAALATGNYPVALGALGDAPALALNAFLNGNTPVDSSVLLPTNLPAFLPQTAEVTLHLPADGILVPPHQASATVSLPGYNPPLPGFPFTVDILGTPFSGVVPLLVNYVPQQLALAIKPAP